MIEPMTHIVILTQAAKKDRLLGWLYKERGFHVMPIEEDAEEWAARFSGLEDKSPEVDAKLNRLQSIVAFCQEFQSNKPGFLDTMLPLKVVGNKEEIASAVKEVDIDLLHNKTTDLRNRLEADQDLLNRLIMRRDAIQQFAFLGDDLPALNSLRHLDFVVVAAAGQGGKAFLLDSRIGDTVIAHELMADQTHTYYALIAPKGDDSDLKALIDDHGLQVYPLPEVEHGAGQELTAVSAEIDRVKEKIATVRAESANFADNWIRKASLAAGQYESDKNLAMLHTRMSASEHLFVARGYVKADELLAFTAKMEKEIPDATVLPTAAPESEDPPTSLKNSKWIRPASLLVNMYGTPAYNSIDPTPFAASIFFIFVGICLGDAAYGILLILLMAWLKRKYKEQKGLQDFFQVFTYCGYAAVVFGILTGSFFSNLSEIIPGMEWFDKIRNGLALIDPIKDSQLALYIAVGIGIATQFYGMGLLFYRNWKRGDKMGAVSDGLLWMCFFGFLILAGLTGVQIFWWLFIASAIGLILTQGRDQSNWLLRIVVGVISLYGIVGAYGSSAFLGDIISYARLMALALTGAALGSTFNMLAQLGGEIAVIGGVFALLILVLGHIMNFFLSLLSAFVHSARLVMLEFFGRFYEAGGYAYKPYGFESPTVEVKKD